MSTPTPPSGPADEQRPPTAPDGSWSNHPTSPGSDTPSGQHGAPGSGSPYGQYGQYGQANQPGQQPAGWGAPAPQQPPAPPPPDAADQGGWGQPPATAAYGAGPQNYGQYGAPGAATPFAVAQPGIIPLRPLTLGELYDGAFKAIRANPAVMFGLAAVVVALVTILQAVVTWSAFEQLTSLAGQTNPNSADLDEMYGTLNASLLPLLVSGLVSFVVTTILNGVLIHSVSQSVIGRTLPLRELWALVRPQLLRLLLLTLVIGLAVAVVLAICLAPGIAVALAGEGGAGAALILLGALVGLLAMLFVIVATVLATPALVLERAGVWTAIRRSWQLTRPTFWRVTGTYLLTSLLVGIVSQVIATPVTMVAQMVGSGSVVTASSFLGAAIATAVTTPFMAGVVALLYIDIRIRTEGLDVELAAAAAGS